MLTNARWLPVSLAICLVPMPPCQDSGNAMKHEIFAVQRFTAQLLLRSSNASIVWLMICKINV